MQRLLPLLVLAVVVTGCTTTRIVTISTKPPDANIKVDGIDRGKGPITETIVFQGADDVHTVTVSRLGYKEERRSLTRDFPGDRLDVELGYLTRRIVINVAPVSANISVDGKPITAEPAETTSIELPFTVDARNNWTTHTIVADRPGWAPASQVVSWQDKEQSYTLRLEPRRKDLTISTTPSGAQLYIDEQPVGTSPAIVNGHPFPVDIETGNVIPQRLRAVKKGYPDVEVAIGWDEGQTTYSIPLVPR